MRLRDRRSMKEHEGTRREARGDACQDTRRYILIGLCILCTWLTAGEGFAQRNVVHARTAALGEAGVGLIGSGQALLYNPAGLAFMERREAYFTSVDWGEGIEEHGVGISTSMLGKGAFGLYAQRTRYSSGEDYTIFGGYGKKITDRIAVGATFKQYISQTPNRFAFDLGAYAIGFRNMVMSVGLENVSSDIRKDARLGLLIDMFSLINAGSLSHHLDVVLDTEIPINSDRYAILNVAIEYEYTYFANDSFFGFSLRLGGFSKDLVDRDNIFWPGPANWGGGLHFRNQWGLGVKIDYTPHFSFNQNRHIVSIAFVF